MFLSRIDLTGFKSYSETITMEPGPRLAVIIGSNGVGKSNALDGIMWALGENDPIKLRCIAPHDLLFAGSKNSPPGEEARVELWFEADGTAYSVGRSLGRSGAERFFARGSEFEDLDDYRGALAELGLGYGRFCVVRQEGLTDFFGKRPMERRSYLDRYIKSRADFDQVSGCFDEYIQAMIPESRASLTLGDDLNDVDVEVTFPDKGPKRAILLSGGEKAVTALALKLALFRCAESPLYLLDEVEPSLDWTRNNTMQELLKRVSKERQLILVTHFQSTIQVADTVHGVRVRPDGSSWLKFHFVMDKRLFKVYKCC